MLNSFEDIPATSNARCGGEAARAAGRADAALSRHRGGWAALAVAALVAACGGGGGDGGAPPVLGYNLQKAYQAFLERGNAQRLNVVVTGTTLCNGTADLVTQVPTDTTFEGRPSKAIGFSNDIKLAASCPFQINGAAGVQYFDAGFGALGVTDTQGYGRYESPPGRAGGSPGPLQAVMLPAVVRAGDGGTFAAGAPPAGGALGTQVLYGNPTLANRQGQTNLSYRVDPDTAVSVLVSLTTETYNNAGTLFSKQVNTYRLTANDAFSLIRSTIDFPTANPPLQLVLTAP